MKWELFREKLELLGIRESCAGVPYIVLPSRENARWLFPVVNRRSFRTGLFLYAPNTVKGHLYKACLSGIPLFFLKVWHRKRIVCLDFSGAKSYMSGTEDAPGFYVGNGGSHSKPTVQLQKGGTPVSYMKFTTDPAIEKLFEWEETALKEVKGIECADVPPVLQHTKFGCAFIFETGSVKKRVGKTDFRFSSAHEGFLLELYRLSKRVGGYAGWRDDMEARLKELPLQDLWMLEWFRKLCSGIDEKSFPMGRIHGDFTPWNCIVERKRLKVFDWEYSRSNCPVFLDALHFVLQPGYLKRQPKMKEIRKRILPLKRYFCETGSERYGLNLMLSIYLLSQYMFYLKRSECPARGDVILMERWKRTLQEIAEDKSQWKIY